MLEAVFPTYAANAWRSIEVMPEYALNFMGADGIAYAINGYGGSGGNGYETRIRLFNNEHMFEKCTTASADSWNQIYVDSVSYTHLALLDALQRNVQAEGDFDWGVAYHPFPEDLKRADFWNDTTAIQSFDTGKITFRNVEILAAYLKQKQFLHRGKIRHIILSEQGLCSGDTPEGERLQADAFVLAFHKIKAISEIEAFIYHSHLDEKNEGLLLGLLAEDGRRKPIYDCFSAIDGPRCV